MGNAAGHGGTFVLPWVQTETDGVRGAAPAMLCVGAQWRWWGEALRIGGAAGLLVLDDMVGSSPGGQALRARAARSVRRLLGRTGLEARTSGRQDLSEPEEPPRAGFTVTDGRHRYSIGVTATAEGGWLAVFTGILPPAGGDLHVIECRCGELAEAWAAARPRAVAPWPGLAPDPASAMAAGQATGAGADPAFIPAGVICFTSGTRIATPDGPRTIEMIRPGDRISTKDDGAQEVLWTGARRMSGARLYALPHLRPVRIRAGAMGEARPESDLIVSPQHRMLVTGAQAQALFNHDEVLVAAADLIDDRTVLTETALREVTYVHLMTARHQIVWANGLETESFHPANTDLDLIAPADRAALLAAVPGLDADRFRYGGHARRNLSASEAAILRHGAH